MHFSLNSPSEFPRTRPRIGCFAAGREALDWMMSCRDGSKQLESVLDAMDSACMCVPFDSRRFFSTLSNNSSGLRRMERRPGHAPVVRLFSRVSIKWPYLDFGTHRIRSRTRKHGHCFGLIRHKERQNHVPRQILRCITESGHVFSGNVNAKHI